MAITADQNRALATADAAELRRLYATGEASPVEVLDAVLQRAHALEPVLNAFLTLDDAGGRRAARAAERVVRTRPVEQWPLLLGVPVSVKDLTPTRGLRTTRGSLLLADWMPDFDPPAVERLRAAGAMIFGKTNTSEAGWKGDAGNRLVGPTANPWATDRSSGGSSGGAAAAVASGVGPLATGTDGAGSIRIPAAFCGVVGFKPSLGRVPYVPASADLLAHLGPLARTVADAAALYDTLAGPDPRDLFSLPADAPTTQRLEAVEPLRIAWCADLGGTRAAPDVREAAACAMLALAEAGHRVEPVELHVEDPYPIVDVLWAGAEAASHRDDLDAVRDRLDPGRVALIERGRALGAADLAHAQAERWRYAEALRQATEAYDVLATPTLPIGPFALGADGPSDLGGASVDGLAWSPFTYPFNLTGQPAISVPAGHDADGLPVGVQLAGRWREDLTVLRAAAALERASPWAARYRTLWDALEATG